MENNNDKVKNYEQKYELMDVIGSGSFGKVYKAKVKGEDEYRAIKIIDKNKIKVGLRNELFKQDVELEYNTYNKDFRKEIYYMKECQKNNNKNSVRFYEYYDTDDEFIIVMELCDDNLSNLIRRTQMKFNLDEIYDLLSQLNNTFKIMHESKIAHRDLKLENILIKYENKEKTKFIYKLSDYGISRKFLQLFKSFSSIAGTLNYMAPEILSKEKYGYECDMWSLGIIIYILYFGVHPYSGITAPAILNQIKGFKQQSLKKSGDPDFDNLIRQLLIAEPKERLTWKNYFQHPFFTKRQKENPKTTKPTEIPKPNEIRIILRIGDLDLDNDKDKDNSKNESKKIYFIENDHYREEGEKENKDINNLNDTNTEIFIDDKKIKFSKYFTPERKGDYKITIKFKNKMKDCSYLFRGCGNIISVDLSSFDSSEVIDMVQMFSICYQLKEVNLNNLNISKVKNMSHLFNKCFELEKITFPQSFNTENVENMNFMFHFCQALKEINFSSSFKTNKVVTMRGIFGKCFNLRKLNLSNFETGEVTDMSFMFDNCRKLQEVLINPSKFITNKVESMGHMFNDCNSLTNFDFSKFNTQKNEFFCSMFENCYQLKNIDLSKFTVSNTADLSNMFNGCSNLENLNLTSLNIRDENITDNMFVNLNNRIAIRVNPNSLDDYKNRFETLSTSFTSNASN